MTDAGKVLSDEDTEFLTLSFAPLALARRAHVEAHPELVHLSEVVQDELDAVADVAVDTVTSDVGELVLRHFAQVVPQEQTTCRMLNSFAHLLGGGGEEKRVKKKKDDLQATDVTRSTQKKGSGKKMN